MTELSGACKGLPLGLLVLALAPMGLVSAQPLDDHQMRCMQIEQELANSWAYQQDEREQLPRIEAEIAEHDRVFQGTQAAMEREGCFESFFIFGRGLVRTPKCMKMNNRMEDARRQLGRLQQQREAILRSGSGQRRNQELQAALARAGCAPQPQQHEARRGGGFFDWFLGGEPEPPPQPQFPTSRIVPGVPYRTVCVRMCDGFFFPISYSTTSANFSHDAQRCQSNCAAPAELFVYRNPGEEIEQAVSLNGQPYRDLPVAFRYRKEYVKGCSCKVSEYSPIEIEASAKRAEAKPATPASRVTSTGQKLGPGATQTTAPAPQNENVGPAPQNKAAAPGTPAASDATGWETQVQPESGNSQGELPQSLQLGITGSPADTLDFQEPAEREADAEAQSEQQPAQAAQPAQQESTAIKSRPLPPFQ